MMGIPHLALSYEIRVIYKKRPRLYRKRHIWVGANYSRNIIQIITWYAGHFCALVEKCTYLKFAWLYKPVIYAVIIYNIIFTVMAQCHLKSRSAQKGPVLDSASSPLQTLNGSIKGPSDIHYAHNYTVTRGLLQFYVYLLPTTTIK